MIRLAALLVTFALAATAGAPNFSGSWKLDTAQSSFGMAPTPQSEEDRIDQKSASELTVAIVRQQDGNRMESTRRFRLDGSESRNQDAFGERTTIARWQGEVLVFDSKATIQGLELNVKERWTLSDAGKVLTMQRVLTSVQGETEQKLVFRKQ